MINEGAIDINLIYQGICEKNNAYKLSLKEAQET
jgi:hypothetical protein